MKNINTYKPGQIKELIDKYFEGNTTGIEDRILHEYFIRDNIDKDLKEYTSLFKAWGDLYKNPDLSYITPLLAPEKNKTNKFKIGVSILTGIAAGLLIFFLINTRPKTYVIIDGIKYTDDITIKNAFETSINNARIDMEEIFIDFKDLDE